MKTLFLILLSVNVAFGQAVSIGRTDGYPNAYVWLPKDYETSTKPCALILSFPHSPVSESDFKYSGIGANLSWGMDLSVNHPQTGEKVSFIVVSIFFAELWDIPGIIRYMRQNYRIDTNRIYLTGFSAGGGMAMEGAVFHDSVSRHIASVVGMSAPTGGNFLDYSLLKKYGIKSLQYVGDQDWAKPHAEAVRDSFNRAYPGSSRLQVYNGGHCCSQTRFDKNWKDTATGWSIYEWMLVNAKPHLSTLPIREEEKKEERQAERKNLHPNPASDRVYLPYRSRLVDMYGITRYEGKGWTNISDLPNGVYAVISEKGAEKLIVIK